MRVRGELENAVPECEGNGGGPAVLATGRGEAFAATADNPAAIYYNPAGITQLDGHNARLGDQVILANGVLIGGHAVIGSRAFLSGNALVHQFTRVGDLALMQGGAGISKDLPPFCVARGVNGMCGLNAVGLRRAGIPADDRLGLKRLYHLLFRSGLRLRVALDQAGSESPSPCQRQLIEFVAATRKGICRDTGLGTTRSETDE